MKKTYNTPKVEKLAFDYTETVTASGIPDGPTNSGWHMGWVNYANGRTRCACYQGWGWVANC